MSSTVEPDSSTRASSSRPGTLGGAGDRVWHRSAPETIAKQTLPGEAGSGWETWQKHLRKIARRERELVESLSRGTKRPRPALWGIDSAEFTGAEFDITDGETDTLQRIERLADVAAGGKVTTTWQEILRPWLAEASGGAATRASAIEALQLAHALPALAARLDAPLWWELLEHLVQTARGTATRGNRSSAADETSPVADPLTTQLLEGELPLTLAWLLPELKPCRQLAAAAGKRLSSGLVELHDGEGTPHARHLPIVRPLLACWTRSRAIDDALDGRHLSEEARVQYDWLVTTALRFTRHDGRPIFARPTAPRWQPDLLATALRLGGDVADRRAAAVSLPARQLPNKKKKKKQGDVAAYDLPEPAMNSEWAATALLRSDWSRSGPRLAVTYEGSEVWLELDRGGGPVLSGAWELDVRLGDTPLAPTGEWEEVCWTSDDDLDYLELEIDLERGVRVQRQLLLARDDGFLYLADIILTGDESLRGEGVPQIDYRGALPLAEGIVFRGDGETREGELIAADKEERAAERASKDKSKKKRKSKKKDRPLGLVLPLALPEWRADPRHGTLESSGTALELRQAAPGRNLCCPLLIDLDRQRATRRRTWRQLTVGESLEIVPHDRAVGYRVQCGRQQWLIYRSLMPGGSRTLIGQNVACELLVARFDPDGTTDELIEIE